jgi:flavin-dependent dehydrogenase
MRYDYDVIVVGGRVAGASTAMLLARRGHRVLLVDRARMPSDTVSTHALLRTAVLQLTRWGLLSEVAGSGAPAIREIMLGFGDERIPFGIKEEHGVSELYAPRRVVLDAIILAAAVDAGAEFTPGTRVTGLERDSQGRVVGARLDDRTTVGARYVVGADGIHSRVVAAVGAEVLESHPPVNAVHYAYYVGVDVPGYWFQFTPGVNAGMIPTNDGAVCVFAGRPRGELGRFRAAPDAEFRRLLVKAGQDLAERVAAGTRVTPYRGTSGLPGFVRKPWGAGWALVGDAGYSKDPISAHGISGATRDAELCANAIDEALQDPDREASAFRQYQARRDALSAPLYREATALAHYGWTAGEASERMRRVSDAVREECRAMASLAVTPLDRTPASV